MPKNKAFKYNRKLVLLASVAAFAAVGVWMLLVTKAAPPGGFETLPVGASLPSESNCAGRVRSASEFRSINNTYNHNKGIGGNYSNPRVTGNFTGTTDEIIQWAACKWGLDEDVLRAQAAKESYWRANAAGDWTNNSSNCSTLWPVKSYGPQYQGDEARSGQCPESVGLLQVRWDYHKSAFYSSPTENASTLTNNAVYSTAYNADYYGSVWRSCFNGDLGWLNDVERGATYAAGDMWGCLGVWFAGRWRTQPALSYISDVQDMLSSRIWEQSSFRNFQAAGEIFIRSGSTSPAPTPAPSPDPEPEPNTGAPLEDEPSGSQDSQDGEQQNEDPRSQGQSKITNTNSSGDIDEPESSGSGEKKSFVSNVPVIGTTIESVNEFNTPVKFMIYTTAGLVLISVGVLVYLKFMRPRF